MSSLIVIIFTILFFIGYAIEDTLVMASALIGLFIYISYYCCKNINSHITLFVFMIAFFTFLMGRLILPLFYDVSELVYDNGGYDFSMKTNIHMYLSVYLALLFVPIGYATYFKSPRPLSQNMVLDDNLNFIRKRFRLIIYFSAPFAFLLVLEKIYFVFSEGYSALYIDYQSRLPYVITVLGAFFSLSFYIFMATLPSKREALYPILMYLSLAVLSLGTGQRGSFILSILFVIMYFFMRNTIIPGETWIGRKSIIILLLSIPLFLIFLFAFAYIRVEEELGDSKMTTNILVSFIGQQGVSVEVIGFGYDFENMFPKGRCYLLGDVIDYFRHNIFSQYLFGAEPVEGQTVKRALEDNSFDATLTYLSKPDLYLDGGGLGGCYIAEAYKDLGYIGICIVSFIYGAILSIIPQWCRKNVIYGAVGLIMFNQIVFAPRAHAIKFVLVFISMVTFLLFFYLYILKKSSCKNIKHEKSKIIV